MAPRQEKEREEFTVEVLSGITSAVVLVAALLYIRDKVRQEIAMNMDHRVKRFFEQYDKDMDALVDSVTPKVDLWWSQTGKAAALKKLRDEAPSEMLMMIPEEIRDEMFDTLFGALLESVRSEATGLAVHLVAEEKHKSLATGLAAIMGAERAKQHLQELEDKLARHMDEHRTNLLEAGIDLDAFEKEFAGTSR